MSERPTKLLREGHDRVPKKVMPSEFMRELRPELYSDTADRATYKLDASLLEYQLHTITARNETHGFEIFCRKLCERTICPNLRPQSGPEGGGDSKADSDNYVVSDEISALTYVGLPNAGREKWAFAFSAKADWSTKVRSDVAGIAGTGREYDRIYFVTSRSTRAKDRARIETELSDGHGVPVTILDRAWIVAEVIEKDRKDLAFNYLGVGQISTDELRLGPTDYSRTQQLEDIEREIENPEAFAGMERQRVTEALIAAKLSRNLERPRTETDGRFLRAIRLAEQDGTYRQNLEARYEYLWTAFWWFDDVEFVNRTYSEFEDLVLTASHARNLEFLANLLQLLVNSVVHDHLTREDSELDDRTERLRTAFEQMAADDERPNNRLEALTSLAIIRLNEAVVSEKQKDLAVVWQEFSCILNQAAALGEFEAGRLISMIEVAGNAAGNDPLYSELVEQLADFVAKRTSEAQGALILLKRARHLDDTDKIDTIRLLGKAALMLTKKEYAEELIEAHQLLTLAYRKAGLLWAARASCVFVATSIIIEAEEESRLPVNFVPTMIIWAWISLELRLLPDVLLAVQMLNGALDSLPLTEESNAKVQKDILDLDLALASRLLNASDAELRDLEAMPDVLKVLGLFASRTALLYMMGYEEVLREDGSIPAAEADEAVVDQLSTLASQPIAKQLAGQLVLNGEDQQTVSTTLLGMRVEVISEGTSLSIMVAQAVLGSLEAFFATVIAQRVVPHTEKVRIHVVESAEDTALAFDMDEMKMIATITWPTVISPTSFQQQETVHRFLVEVIGKVLAAAFIMDDAEDLIETLFVEETVQNRMTMIVAAGTSYHRVAGKSLCRLSDWHEFVDSSYAPRLPKPTLKQIEFERTEDEGLANRSKDKGAGDGRRFEPEDHRTLSIRSVIDIHAWDTACWKGAGFLQLNPVDPPVLALLFENRDGAVAIFERWQERFGQCDEKEEIHLALIRDISVTEPYHYAVQVTSRLPELGEIEPNKPVAIACRTLVIEPDSDTNIEMFLSSFRRNGAYRLMPAVLRDGKPEWLFGLAILKRELTIKSASEINENDIESIALRQAERRDPQKS